MLKSTVTTVKYDEEKVRFVLNNDHEGSSSCI